MGTWAAGPFQSDTALDYLGDVVDEVSATLEQFVESPEIDEGFEEAFAAAALLNVLAHQTPAAPPEPDRIAAWAEALLRCFDGQIDTLDPDAGFKVEQRAALEMTFAELAERSRKFWKR